MKERPNHHQEERNVEDTKAIDAEGTRRFQKSPHDTVRRIRDDSSSMKQEWAALKGAVRKQEEAWRN